MLMMLAFRPGETLPQTAGGAADAHDAGLQARVGATAGRRRGG